MNGIHYAKCEICGKKDYAEKLMMLGGAWNYLCKDCMNLADKIIRRYITRLRREPFETVVQTIMEMKE